MFESGLPVNDSAKLIVTIVKKGAASKVVAATKKAGATGGTIIRGRGTANKSIYLKILGLDYEPEKEIILIAAKQAEVDKILKVIEQAAEITKPGNGIGFVLDLKWLLGIVHLLENTATVKTEGVGGELDNG